MGSRNTESARQSSVGALKMVYYVILGLAITEALRRTFSEAWLCEKVFDKKEMVSVLLLLAFVPTICRFGLGASLHLDVHFTGQGSHSLKRAKLGLDFVAFFFQALLFYLMAVTIEHPGLFMLFLFLMILFDAAWLVVLRCKKYIDWNWTETQWLVSDALIVVALFIIWCLARTMGSVGVAIAVCIVAIVATVFDFCCNRNTYFPAVTQESRTPHQE